MAKTLVIKNTKTNATFSFNEKVNLVTEKHVAEELKRTNYDNEDTKFVISSENDISIADVVQVKISLKEVGYFVANFLKEQFPPETKEKAFEELGKLKTENVDQEIQNTKINKFLNILGKYNPIYLTYIAKGDFQYTKESLTDLLMQNDLNFPILCLTQPKKTKEPKLGKTEKANVNVVSNEKPYSYFLKKYKIDYIFGLLFSIILSFSMIYGVASTIAKDSIGVFLIIISVAFIGLLTHCNYKYQKSIINFKYKPRTMLFILLASVIGITIGLIVGYFVSVSLIDKENPVNMTIPLIISVASSIVALVIATFFRLLINLLKKRGNK